MAKKILLIVKANEKKEDLEGYSGGSIINDLVFMEINKPVLENMYNISTVSLFF